MTNILWPFDELAEQRLFINSWKSPDAGKGFAKIFGRDYSRSVRYTKKISGRELRGIIENEFYDGLPEWRSYFGLVIEKGFLSPVVGFLGVAFPRGCASLPLVINLKNIDREIVNFSRDFGFSEATNKLSKRYESFDFSRIKMADSLDDLMQPVFMNNLRVVVEVAAVLSWDMASYNYVGAEYFDRIMFSDDRNQKGFLKCPQRIFIEILIDAVEKIDSHVGYKERNKYDFDSNFFNGDDDKKKIMSGKKRLSLEDYDSRFLSLWPENFREKIREECFSIAVLAFFSVFCQGLFDRLGDALSATDFEAVVQDCRLVFERAFKDCNENGAQYMARINELLKEQMQASAP